MFAELLRALAGYDEAQLAACREALPLAPFFRETQQLAKIGSFSRDFATGENHWSEELQRIYGSEPNAPAPTFEAFLELVHPEDQATVLAARKQTMATAAPVRYLYRFRRADGLWRHARAVVRAQTDAAGQVRRLFGTVQDVTTERQAIEDLRSVARFPETNPNPVLRLTRAGILAYANTASEPLLRELAMAVGQPVPPALVAPLDVALATGTTQRFNLAVGERLMAFALTPQPDGRHANLYGHDITDLDGARQEGGQAEPMLQVLLETMTDPVAFVSDDGLFLRVNTAFARAMTQGSAAEAAALAGKPLTAVFDGETTREILARNLDTLADGRPRLNDMVRTLTIHDGRVRHLHVSRAPVRDASGRMLGVCAVGRDVTEWQQATEALADSEARYKRLFDDAILGAFRTTVSGRVLSVNPAMARLFGYDSPADMIESLGEAGLAFQHPGRRLEIIRQLGADDGLLNFENSYRRKDGSLFIGNLHARLTYAADGDHVLEGFIEDITARKAVERELAASEDRLKTHLRNFPLPALTFRLLERDLVLTDANKAAEVFFRGRIDTRLGSPAETLFDQSPDIYLALWDTFETRRTGKHRLAFRPPGGAGPGLFDMTFVFVAPDTVMLHVEEITPLSRVREDLRRTSDQLRGILEHVPCAVTFTDPDGRCLLANQAGGELFAWPESAADAPLDPKDQALLQEGGSITFEEERRFQGESRYFLMTKAALCDETGRGCALCSLALDITARKNLERDIEAERDTLRTVLGHVPYAASLVATDGRTLYLNQRFTELIGYTLADIPDAKSWMERAYPDPTLRATVVADWESCLGRPSKRIYPVCCGDGLIRRIAFDAVNLPDGSMLLTLTPAKDESES